MTWLDWFDRLPDEVKLFVSEAVLEKNKEIQEIVNKEQARAKGAIKHQEYARAFRELVETSEKVKRK